MQHMKGSQFAIGELPHPVFSYQSWKFLKHNTTLKLETIFIFTTLEHAFGVNFPYNHGNYFFLFFFYFFCCLLLLCQVETISVGVITKDVK